MITATYTDPFTGWEQRVTVSGETIPTGGETRWIGNTNNEVARATSDVLTDFRFEQDARRIYLPEWQPKPEQTED